MSAEDPQNNENSQTSQELPIGGIDWERRERESMDEGDLDSIDVPPPPPPPAASSDQTSPRLNNFPGFRMPREEGDQRPSFYINDVGTPKANAAGNSDQDEPRQGESDNEDQGENASSALVWPPQRPDQSNSADDGGLDLGAAPGSTQGNQDDQPATENATVEAKADDNETVSSQENTSPSEPAPSPAPALSEVPAAADAAPAAAEPASTSQDAPERATVQHLDLDYIFDYRSGEPVKADDNIEERRLSAILPFIAMLGYNPFDRRQVKVQSGGYRLVGEEASLAVRIDPNNEDSFEGAVLTTNGPEWKIEVATEKGPATLAVFNLNSQQSLPSMFGWVARDTLNVEALLQLGANGALEDVLREAILAELRNPSKAFRQAITDRLFERGFDDNAADSLPAIGVEIAELIEQTLDDKAEDSAPADEERRSMSPAEAEAFAQIKALLSRHVEEDRIYARPNSRYTAVLIDDNNRKTVARLHFDRPVKQLGTFVDRTETRHVIETPADVVAHAGRMTERLEQILKAPPKSQG